MIARTTAGGSHAGGADSVVACTIGDEQFALRGADACEIVRADRMRRAGGAESFLGMLYLNREVVPVYALAAALARPTPSSTGSRPGGNHIVVTRGAAGMVGWLVDRIARPATDGGAQVIPLPAIVGPVATKWFEGLVRIGDRSLLLLSPANVDPRAPTRPARDDGAGPAPGVATRAAADEGRSPLVLLFSSPALPPCGTPRFALSARRIAAVIRSQPVTDVPGSARHVRGVIVWRDTAVPVIDARGKTDLRVPANDDRLVVARCGAAMGGALVAFPIGTDVTLHQPTRADRAADDTRNSNRPFVAGVYSVAGNRVALLDLEAAIASLAG